EGVPDGRRTAILCRGSLDLVSGGRRTEKEALGEAPHGPVRAGGRHGIRPGGAGPDADMLRSSHALTAPSMIPLMICRPKMTKMKISGTVATAVAENTSE